MKQQLADLLGIDIRDEWLSSLSLDDCRWYYGLAINGMIEEIPTMPFMWMYPGTKLVVIGNPDRAEMLKRRRLALEIETPRGVIANG